MGERGHRSRQNEIWIRDKGQWERWGLPERSWLDVGRHDVAEGLGFAQLMSTCAGSQAYILQNRSVRLKMDDCRAIACFLTTPFVEIAGPH